MVDKLNYYTKEKNDQISIFHHYDKCLRSRVFPNTGVITLLGLGETFKISIKLPRFSSTNEKLMKLLSRYELYGWGKQGRFGKIWLNP